MRTARAVRHDNKSQLLTSKSQQCMERKRQAPKEWETVGERLWKLYQFLGKRVIFQYKCYSELFTWSCKCRGENQEKKIAEGTIEDPCDPLKRSSETSHYGAISKDRLSESANLLSCKLLFLLGTPKGSRTWLNNVGNETDFLFSKNFPFATDLIAINSTCIRGRTKYSGKGICLAYGKENWGLISSTPYDFQTHQEWGLSTKTRVCPDHC